MTRQPWYSTMFHVACHRRHHRGPGTTDTSGSPGTPPGLPQPLYALPQPEVLPDRDFPLAEKHVDLPAVIHQARLDTSTVPLQDQHHHSFFVYVFSGTPFSSINMAHSSFFPTPETTLTSDDVFTVAQPTSGVVTTITSSTRRQPLIQSTPISSHTSPS